MSATQNTPMNSADQNDQPGFFKKALSMLTGPTARTIGIAVASAAAGAVVGVAYTKQQGQAAEQALPAPAAE